MQETTLKQLYSAESIAERVEALAAQVNADYQGKSLVVVCVLKGAFIFFADLVRRLTVSPVVDFVRLASYGQNDSSSGTIAFTKDVDLDLAGRDVLIVEDIVDSGVTMAFLVREMRQRGVSSLRIAALVDKYERREVDVPVDYAGFRLTSGFIVGYGLDYAERYRELPGIYTVETESHQPDAAS